jgi:hypothetical protein
MSSGTCIRRVALNASGIGTSSRFFPTVYGKRLRFLVRNNNSFSSPNLSRGDSLFRGSERRQSTLAACSTVSDESSTYASKGSESGADTKKSTARRKKSTASKKEVTADTEEKKVPAKKKTRVAKTGRTAAKATEKASAANQEEKQAATSKSKGTSKEKKTVTKPKRVSKAKVSASAAAKNRTKTSADGSGSESKPLVPLYPPTAKSVVVVESATKAKVIQKYLGDMYQVLPSYGHVRDLAGRSRSVRPDDDFSMVWEVPTAAWTHLKSIKVALKGYVFWAVSISNVVDISFLTCMFVCRTLVM